jgi:hypothetical protein
MKTLVFTIAQNGYGTAFLSCIASQRAYAKRIGADYVSVTKPRRIPAAALSAWLKVPLMLHALESGYDWVAYIDADCEVKPDAPDFRNELGSSPKQVFMALGRSGRVNSGVMIARRGPESTSYFARVLASATENIPADDRANLKYENGNVIYVTNLTDAVATLPAEWNNSLDPDLADYIRHYTGPMRARLTRSLPRELQYRIVKFVQSRRLATFARQPESRSDAFVADLQRIEEAAVSAFPRLRAARESSG